jgi:hypothetical protein
MKNRKYIMVTREFGTPVYIAPLSGKLSGINVTGIKAEAEKWDERDTASPHKLDYHKAISGYKELKFEAI